MTPVPDPFNLHRFLSAQEPVIEQVRQELRAGRKRSHWMWFIFPQLAGLGHSPMARHYALAGLAEARAFLAHPLLGPRLIECIGLVNHVKGRSIHDIFGSPDDRKFHSSITLFATTAPDATAFRTALDRHFAGAPDLLTTQMLAGR